MLITLPAFKRLAGLIINVIAFLKAGGIIPKQISLKIQHFNSLDFGQENN